MHPSMPKQTPRVILLFIFSSESNQRFTADEKDSKTSSRIGVSLQEDAQVGRPIWYFYSFLALQDFKLIQLPFKRHQSVFFAGSRIFDNPLWVTESFAAAVSFVIFEQN
jgi:hypothetical protein